MVGPRQKDQTPNQVVQSWNARNSTGSMHKPSPWSQRGAGLGVTIMCQLWMGRAPEPGLTQSSEDKETGKGAKPDMWPARGILMMCSITSGLFWKGQSLVHTALTSKPGFGYNLRKSLYQERVWKSRNRLESNQVLQLFDHEDLKTTSPISRPTGPVNCNEMGNLGPRPALLLHWGWQVCKYSYRCWGKSLITGRVWDPAGMSTDKRS